MARQPTPDGRRVHMNVKFSEAEAAAVDEARGDVERGTWLRETVLRDLPIVVVTVPAPPERRRKPPVMHGQQAVVPRPVPKDGPGSPPPQPRVSAGTATAVFQPAGAEPVTGAPVPAIRRASDITPPPRCQHKGTRITGGWCVPCQADVKPGGKLPADWVMPEGWSPS